MGHKLNLAKMMKPDSKRVENIMQKGENAVILHFLLFLEGFLKSNITGQLKFGIVWWRDVFKCQPP